MSAKYNSTTARPTASDSPSPTGKRLFGVGMLAVGIAAGALFAPASFAGAQDEADDATDTAPERHREHRGHRGEVLETLGIDAEAIRAGIEADQSLAQIAEANGVSEADLVAAIQADVESHVAAAVEGRRITQEEADEKLADLADKVSERINTLPSERQDRRGERRADRRASLGGDVLEELGLTVEDIQTGREAGQTLAEMAAANGVSESDLLAALVAQATERAETAVEAGRIDADRAAQILDRLEERVTERVNAEPGD